MLKNIGKKYPRTYHFSFSPEVHSDDKVQFDISNLIGKEIVVLFKLDGGNTTLKKGGPFARSHSQQASCRSFDYIKAMHQYPKEYLMGDLNYHGENMFATHSIYYSKLKDFFYLFNVSNDKYFFDWDSVVSEAKRLSFSVVPELFRGVVSSESELQKILENGINGTCPLGGSAIEGFVVRPTSRFKIEDFSSNVVKYVRKGHVQTDKHWSKRWTPNKLSSL